MRFPTVRLNARAAVRPFIELDSERTCFGFRPTSAILRVFDHPEYVGGNLNDVGGVAYGHGTIAGDFSSDLLLLVLAMKVTF